MSTLTLNLSEKLVKDIIESDASLKAEIDALVIDKAAKSFLTKGIEKRVERMIKNDLSDSVNKAIEKYIQSGAFGLNHYSTIKEFLYDRIASLVDAEVEKRIRKSIEEYAEVKIKELVDTRLGKESDTILLYIDRVIEFKINSIIAGLMDMRKKEGGACVRN